MDDVLVIGEALTDIVSTADGTVAEYPGGSPANVALGLARLGRRTSLLTRVGNDDRGRAIQAHLRDSGVHVLADSVTSAPTSTATATLDANGAATYQFAFGWSIPEGVDLSIARAVHTGSLAAFEPPGGDVVVRVMESARDRHLVSYDPNMRPQLMGDPKAALVRVERIVALADVVKVSDEDIAWLMPGADPLDVVRSWQAGGPALVVLTRGGAGATGVVAGGVVDVAARPIEVVDTVGAGDAFMSGLLDALANAGVLQADRKAELGALAPAALSEILEHAGRVAAYTCTRPGADPPTRAELDATPH